LWSDQILHEVGEAMARNGYTEVQRQRRLGVMQEHFPEALLEVPQELITAVSTIPDLRDCHVLAAAIASKANAIVTQNTKHFLPECLNKYGVLCQNADDFLIHQYFLGPEQMLEKLDEQASDVKQERNTLLQMLSRAAPRFSRLVITGELPD
jgi:predicted nucleic acid-binding protein